MARQVVCDVWIAFTESFEGGVPCLYNDIEGKTTIAYGNLCDSPAAVVALPLMHPGGIAATPAEKIAAFHAVHDDPHAAAAGWQYAARLSPLRLTREGMTELALARLEMNNADLVAQLPEFEDYGACAQVALHSWAWACGSRSPFPKMMAAVRARDFASYARKVVDGFETDVLTGGAAVEIFIKEWTTAPDGTAIKNAGLVPRNVANRILMCNAAHVDAFQLDPDFIEWKIDLTAANAETRPEVGNPPSSE